MTDEKEKKNKQIALLSTIGVHAAVLLIMFFVIAWRAPNPPNPEFGIVLNYGTDNEGSGDIQPKEPVGSEKREEEKTEESKPEEKVIEEVKEDVKPVETKEAEVQPVTTTESPVVIKPKKEEPKPVEKPKEEPKKEEPKKVNPETVFKPSTKTESDKSTEGKEGKPGSQGDDKGKTGDKGDPHGDPDANAMYGKPGGGGGGSSLELSGWQWDEKPVPNVPNNESGRVVFEIKVDDNGDIISIKTLERSVSAEAEQACRKSIERLTFTKTGNNVPEVSTGRITFVVRAK
jgi:outer membrane biosynthesis protein TonB